MWGEKVEESSYLCLPRGEVFIGVERRMHRGRTVPCPARSSGGDKTCQAVSGGGGVSDDGVSGDACPMLARQQS